MRSVICYSVRQRWVLSILSMGVCMLTYLSPTAFAVALVAMVNGTNEMPLPLSGFSSDNQTQTTQILVDKLPIYNWSRQTQGYILSGYYWGYLPLQVFGGTIAQRVGGKWVVASALFGVAVFEIISPLSTRGGAIVLLVVTAMKGMIYSVIWPVTFAIYGRWVPPQEISALGSFADVGGTLGQFIGLVISGPISESEALGGWPAVFYTNGALSFTLLIIWCLLVSNTPGDHPCISEEELNYIEDSLKSNQQEANKAGVPWKRILLSRATISLLIASFGFGWVVHMTASCLPQFMNDVLHLTIRDNSVLLSFTALPKSLTVISASNLSDFIVRREWIRKTVLRKLYAGIGFLGLSCVFMCLTIVPRDKWTIASLLIVGLALFGQFSSVVYCIVPLDLTPEYSGTVSAISQLVVAVGGIVMPIVVGRMTKSKTRAEWDRVFYLTIVVIIITNMTFILFGTADRQYQWTENNPKEDFEKNPLHEKRPLFSKKDSQE